MSQRNSVSSETADSKEITKEGEGNQTSVSVATIYYEWDEESIRSYRELIDYDHSVAEVEDLLLEGTKRFSW